MNQISVGVVGVGKISGIYLKNLTTVFSDRVRVLGCADLLEERAVRATSEYNLPKSYASPDELIADPKIDLVLNLTIPAAHYDICRKALEAGKHTYVEKPLCVELEDGMKLVELAAKKGVRLGCAPDTFLGAGIQTCRKLIDDNWIGEPVAAVAFMAGHGHESWHPDPEFYYKAGGGPMFDMGPYYLTALVNLVGPIRRITGSTRITFPERIITSEPKKGTVITVDVPTHVAGVLDFENGAIGTIITSFDVWAANLPRIEIYGTLGSLSVPDPNTFGGPIQVKRRGDKEWHPIPHTHGHAENERGIGVAEMADAIQGDRPHRASGDLACHVLEAMHGVHRAAEAEKHYHMETKGQRPAALEATF